VLTECGMEVRSRQSAACKQGLLAHVANVVRKRASQEQQARIEAA
jgi:hypothetical protein